MKKIQKDNNVTIGLIQTTVSEDITVNMKRTIEQIKEAAKKDAQIICLQELYRTRYFPQYKKRDVIKWAETIPGESTIVLSSLAKELSTVIIVPIFEKGDNGKYYNSAVVIDADGRIMDTYRKIHIPHDPLFYEKDYFDAGDLGYRVYKTRYASFAVLICYDQWFPEAARINALNNADILFYPAAIGWIKDYTSPDGDWHNAWETIQCSHAIANGVHIAAVNRVGDEGKLRFWGTSFVCDSFGKVLKRASCEKEEVLVTKLDLSKNKRIQKGWGFLTNRRPDTYGLLTKKTNRPFSDKTPRELGYSMPAEWEEHDAVWLAWPYDPKTFPDRVNKVEEIYVQIIETIHKGEDVNLFVKDDGMKAKVAKLIEKKEIDSRKIHFYLFDYADVWFRDYGPIFLTNKDEKGLSMVHWGFDAWGKKYKELMKDAQIPSIINQKMQLIYFKPRIVLEGGSIDVNGKGTLLTTEQCLLNKNRNPHLSKEEIERYLIDNLGVSHIIWLKQGITGDDTDGHIDDIARFVNPVTILCAYEEDEKDENFLVLKRNYELLLESKDQDGNKLDIVKLPMPKFVGDKYGRLPASYANFYIGNKVVLVPTFGHKNDQVALGIIQEVFPDRIAVGIDCIDLVYGMGAIHCITQQQPSVFY
ncbi:MAG: agmatine deiminase family protein [Nitrospinota bacterium]